MRIKKVEIEGQEFTIAPLTMAQVEALTDGEQPAAGDVKAWRKRAMETVCTGLNNASPEGSRQTPLSLRSTMDLLTFNALHSAVLELSGLKVAAPGEAAAAPDSTSLTSAAA